MTENRKKRMAMLDQIASAKGSEPASTVSATAGGLNRALRAARTAIDSHHLWELDPDQIADTRLQDRIDPEDVADLRDAIEQNGQTVPILVRRDPAASDRYLLVYGRRRLEAIRQSDRVHKVRALVAEMDDDGALRAQISENMARRDLSYIEKALLARELVETGFGSQKAVADVLTVTASSVSMALSVVDRVGADLVRVIGPAHGVGRPRWVELGDRIEASTHPRDALLDIAARAYEMAAAAPALAADADPQDPSLAAFEAVLAALAPPRTAAPKSASPSTSARTTRPLVLDGARAGTIDSSVPSSRTSSAVLPKASACVCAKKFARNSSCTSVSPSANGYGASAKARKSAGTSRVPWWISW